MARTHELPIDAVTRQRRIKMPILRDDAKLEDTQFLEGAVKRWANIEVEYLSSFYPPHLSYVVLVRTTRMRRLSLLRAVVCW